MIGILVTLGMSAYIDILKVTEFTMVAICVVKLYLVIVVNLFRFI